MHAHNRLLEKGNENVANQQKQKLYKRRRHEIRHSGPPVKLPRAPLPFNPALAVALSVSGASRSRLCLDGTCVHLSGPADMPDCIRPEVRFPLDQRILCSDRCKKMYYV